MSKIKISNKVTRDYLKEINLKVSNSEIKLLRIAKCNESKEVIDIYSFAINKERRERIITSDLATVLADTMTSVNSSTYNFAIEYNRNKLNGVAYSLILYPIINDIVKE